MTWMNEWDVEEAVRLTRTYAPGSGWDEAAVVLQRLMEWTNESSDGWPYWPLPSRASVRLQTRLTEQMNALRRGLTLTDLDPAEATVLYRPIKSFLTRQNTRWSAVLGLPAK